MSDARVSLRRRQIGTAGLALAGGVLAGGPAPADAQVILRRDGRIPPHYFGMHCHRPLAGWPQLELDAIRLWDTKVHWFDLQPSRDRWNFSLLDAIVDSASRRGVAVLMVLGMTPTWAAARPEERSPYGVNGAASEPKDIHDWVQFVRAVAGRYRGRVRHYEIWNEINTDAGFFSGAPEVMIELQSSAYDVIKSVDPNNIVVSPSVEGVTEGKFRYFDRYLELMSAKWADVIGYHFYGPRRSPEELLPAIARVRSIMRARGVGHLPLWNTESGWRVNHGGGFDATGVMATWPNLPEDRAASWMARALLVGWVAGLDAYFWYSYDNRLLGVVSESRAPSRLSHAWGFAKDALRDSTALEIVMDRRGVVTAFIRHAQGTRRLMWTRNDEQIEVRPDWFGMSETWSLRPMIGERRTHGQGPVVIGGAPVSFEVGA